MRLPDPLVVVPARGGSKRLPRKNIRRLGNQSLIGWTLMSARAAGFSQVLLTTEDDEIATEGAALGYWQPFRRPAELALDNVTSDDVVIHLLDRLRDTYDWEPKNIILLPATSPFRSPALINDVTAYMDRSPATEAVISVKRVGVALGYVYTDDNGILEPVGRIGDTRNVYVPSGAVYMVRTSAFRAQSTFLTRYCAWVAHDGISTIDIDTPSDWSTAEALLETDYVRQLVAQPAPNTNE